MELEVEEMKIRAAKEVDEVGDRDAAGNGLCEGIEMGDNGEILNEEENREDRMVLSDETDEDGIQGQQIGSRGEVRDPEDRAGSEPEMANGKIEECAVVRKVDQIHIFRSCEHLDHSMGRAEFPGSVARAAEFTYLCREVQIVSRMRNNLNELHPICLVLGCRRPRTGDLHVCLGCVFWSCKAHLHSHYRTSGHALWFSLELGEVFCFPCRTIVYRQDVESILDAQRGASRTLWRRFLAEGKSLLSDEKIVPTGQPVQKRPRVNANWSPTDRELEALRDHGTSVNLPSLAAGSTNVTGLYNLGNTCYMNSVLQALLFTPPLRNYFLADLHRVSCRATEPCLACAMDELVMDTYKGPPPQGRSFLIPNKFMDIIWRNAELLATYAQHDAHELLITTLNMLHSHCTANSSDNLRSPSSSTRSIIEQIFLGQLRSDVTCQSCGNSSPTFENFFDISVDVDVSGNPVPFAATTTGSGQSGSGDAPASKWEDESAASVTETEKIQTGSADQSVTLTDCLSRFTQPESLGQGNKMECKKCQCRQEASKQLSLRLLPPVLCIHLKRFEHLGSVGNSQKLEAPVEFPVSDLDLTAFTAMSVLRKRHQWKARATEDSAPTPVESPGMSSNVGEPPATQRSANPDTRVLRSRGKDLTADIGSVPSESPAIETGERPRESSQPHHLDVRILTPSPIYDLYAVVNHVGKIDRGHYTTLVRWKNFWFRCDDDKVSREPTVGPTMKSNEAYILFYARRTG